jgi:hypothetical protein
MPSRRALVVVLAVLALALPAPALGRIDVSYSPTDGLLLTASTISSVQFIVREDEGVLEWAVRQLGTPTPNIVAGIGCRQVSIDGVFCFPSGSRAVTAILSDGFRIVNDGPPFSDSLSMDEVMLPDVPTLTASMTVDGGDGRDDIQGSRGPDALRGGDGPDLLEANLGDDVVEGEEGDDTLFATNFRTITGAESVEYNGVDTYRGGPGTDTVGYVGRDLPVSVTLDGQRNDGAANEGDDVVEVENVSGGLGGDTIVGDGQPNALEGLDGNDVVDGGAGDDELGGGGQDDRLVGGPGADTLIGGRGNDRLFGGTGDDELLLRDGEFDVCPDPGTGADTIDADLKDQKCVAQLVRQRATIAGRTRDDLGSSLDVAVGAIDEGPNVVITSRRVLVGDGSARVRLACPHGSGGCRGVLRLSEPRAGTPLGASRYRLGAGRRGSVSLALGARARGRARALGLARLTAREEGRSGPKTTVALLPTRAR